MLDVLCIGDSVIDIFLTIPPDDPKFSLDKEKNQLRINYGDKISVEKYKIGIGGNATNAAVGISRLGLKTGLCAEIGKDEFSERIINHLKSEKVDTSSVTEDPGKQTSVTVALSYNGDRTLFTEHVERNHDFDFTNISTKMVYLTSLGHVWENAYKKVYEYVKSTGTKLAFNPGALQLEKKDKFVMDIIEISDHLFLNVEEAEEILYGKQLGIDLKNDRNLIKRLLFGLKSMGAKNVVITDGERGSYIEDSQNIFHHLDIVKTTLVEQTGAGDAYNSAFLAAALYDLPEKEAMKWGALNSSSVIGKIGAEEGLLTKSELESKLKALTDLQPEEI